MPIYEYKCEKCGNRFEKQQSMGDPAPGKCPSNGCRGKVTRVFSAPAIMFKGKGWHVNDYGRGKGSKPAPAACPSSESCAKAGSCPAAAASSSD
jgi:putative FmdB family regulatory protein